MISMSDADRARRATTILEMLRRLDSAGLDEVLVMARCLDRLDLARRASVAGNGKPMSLLDEALRLELTDVRVVPPKRKPTLTLTIGAQAELDRRRDSAVAQFEARQIVFARIRSARQLTSLSLGQAARILGHDQGRTPGSGAAWLSGYEAGELSPSDGLIADMASAYGVTIEWLRGADPVIEPDTAAALRDADISTDDRASLTELIGAVQRGEG